MSQPNYWLDLFTAQTWQEFLAAGAAISGFREGRWKAVQQIKPKDILLCYLTGISRFIGVLEVTSKPFKDSTPIWKQDTFPSRVSVKLLASLKPETAVPILELRNRVSIFETAEQKGKAYWTGFVRGSPSKWKSSDGEAIVEAVMSALQQPVIRPFDPAKLAYKPKPLPSKAVGSVVVPEPDTPSETGAAGGETRAHGEIQWMLAKLGNDMGLDVWVARNDPGKELSGKRFTDLVRLRVDLPLQFDEATNKTVELIDVLWLQKHSIVAAFEIESTTSIYSGLLRMSDLISMQPNLSIPLFIVAPDERREKVIAEVNRPTFSKLSPPMYEMCRFIAFSTLRGQIDTVGKFVHHLKPEFIDDLAESCQIEDV